MYDLYIKILNFFKGDHKKTHRWFNTANPLLGDVSPNQMIDLGNIEKLKKFVNNCIEENNE